MILQLYKYSLQILLVIIILHIFKDIKLEIIVTFITICYVLHYSSLKLVGCLPNMFYSVTMLILCYFNIFCS